ncbi:MAG: pyridoxal-phosphate-dependent aminotransferase family protein [Acidobacteriota bacterium]|jgi:aspartate aminotransferase-like enzyme|nr:alanine--glyoxylate aminotransferase family protein [Bryobacteraceae bacterium CoA2 C42]MCA2965663.1 alanine--glyoxylate aminotransferase family protein [Acidobacteriaceae bacterium]
MHIKKQRLLTPGPTPLYPPALQAMMASDVHHRTQDFIKIQASAMQGLKKAMGTSNDTLILTASGSGAMEASVSNFFSRGDKVVVCSAGKFGERWAEMVAAFGLDAIVLTEEYGSVVSPERLAETLAANPEVKGVFIQASETSTGAAHDVEAMAKIIAPTEAIFIVDAITGLGTMPLDIDGWGIDICIGGSQKSFMIPPGLAFISVSAKAWGLNARSCMPRYYFDLKREKKMADKGETAWTPNTSHLIALNVALEYINNLGMDKLIENAQLLAKATRAAAAALGLELFAPRNPGSSVTAIKSPAGIDSGVIVKGFRTHFGAIIANGQGSMQGKIFRMAHLGYFDFADMFAVIAGLELLLLQHGHPVELGAGVAAVQRLYAEVAMPQPVKA